ncbi:MAG: glycine cleavage T C-terminal barrel domain-containing protein, partial [Alphaproteobacteria bacterium]|nr:glycine cleavage T C-terminal barrel domain-containing protein [Alphaproteobacteria bacterium]
APIDYARYYKIQKSEKYIYDRCYETAFKIYNPPVHGREPYSMGRNLRSAPYYLREKELGGHFMELSGWERAHGYASNEDLLEKYGDRVPERLNEWDNRHFWRVSNAEHLELSENVGMVNLSHFAIYDVTGPDAAQLMEYVSSSKVAGDTAIGKGVYTNFLDDTGGVIADLTVLRIGENRFQVIDGADAGNRDATYLRRMAQDKDWDVFVEDRTDHFGCIGVWGPNARETLKKLADNPAGLDIDNFGFGACKDFTLRGIPVKGFRISYVGEQGWELHFSMSYGLALWDMFREVGITPVGIETYANSRRLEKSLRLQNADLLAHYNLLEAGLARPKVKAADFRGKAANIEQRALDHQAAMLCTMTVTNNIDKDGVARFMMGNCPIIDPRTGEVLIDSKGRRSYTTSFAYGPSVGKNIALGYLPHDYCEEGRELEIEYINQKYNIVVEAVGMKSLYDPTNARMKS